ncbi:outer membrane protein assembly factor BamA [Desulfocastanea catecholica]
MTIFSKIFFHTEAKLAPIFCLALSFFLLLAASPVQAGNAKTSFLPLSIKSPGEMRSLQEKADRDLQGALGQTDIFFLSRSEAEKLANYQGSWPPPVKVMQEIAAKTDSYNLVTGTLTQIGSQISVDIKLFDLLSPGNPTYYYQTVDSPDGLRAAFDTIVFEITRYTEKEFRIASLAPEGNKRIDSGAILRKITTKVGDAYDQATLRKDLKEIYSMGYFNDVQIDVSDTPKGKKVIFRVVEKPVIKSVIFTGMDEVKEEDVKGAANIKEHFILNPAKITVAEEAIRQLYKTKGFYNSKVISKISYPNDQGAVVEFNIDEGVKMYIKEISVEGNTTFDDDELLDQIETSEKWFLSWLTEGGLLDMNMVQQDAARIVTYYNDQGFLEAKIGEPEIKQEEEWLYVKFIVEEGTRFKLGTVDFTGDLLQGKDEMMKLLTIQDEEYLSRQAIRDDILKLTDYYSEAGFAFADIRPIVKKTPAGDHMDVTFDIRKNNLVYIERISIRGNSRTRDNVIRRELLIAEGGVFDSKALRESTQALQRLTYFEEVNIIPEPSLNPDRMNVIVEVKEKSTGNFSIGAGFSSADNLILMGQISENNFLGRGDTLSLSANISSSSSRYNLGYTNPHLYDSALSWGLDLFSTEREYDDYTKESVGGGIRIGYPIFGKWKVFGNYSYTDTDLTDVSENASYIIQESVDLHITSAVKMSLVRDTRNRLYGASKGSRNVLSVKYAGGPLGGDAQFTKVEGSSGWYFPMPLKTVFHVEGSAGQVFENEDDKLPVYERFYLGGLNSVRGFEYGKISPIDPITGERIGGDKMWYTNVELIFPLMETQGLHGLVFYDAGQVMDDDENWGEVNDNIKNAVGLGIQWLSPMGPLSVVWGFNLDPLDDEDDAVWDFSVGGTF